MNIVSPSATLIWVTPNAEKIIEEAGRTCYKSEDKITEESSKKFIKMIMKRGHESVLEHASASFRFVTTRFTTHQLVRHRLFSYSQESQRYCNYTKGKFGSELTFVRPLDIENDEVWKESMKRAEQDYQKMIDMGYPPQDARTVLPSSCKTEIVTTGNFRNWRHFLKLRMSSHAQSDIRYLAQEVFSILSSIAPNVFSKESLCK